jgi:hypothetical protein
MKARALPCSTSIAKMGQTALIPLNVSMNSSAAHG